MKSSSCRRCPVEVARGSRFCSRCGSELTVHPQVLQWRQLLYDLDQGRAELKLTPHRDVHRRMDLVRALVAMVQQALPLPDHTDEQDPSWKALGRLLALVQQELHLCNAELGLRKA